LNKKLQTVTSESLLKQWQSFISLPTISVFLITYVVLFLFVDRYVAEFFHDHQYFYALKFVNIFAIGYGYVVMFAVLALYFKYRVLSERWAHRMGFMSVWFVIMYTVCGVLKVLCGRARPPLWFSEHIYGFHGIKFQFLYWSFPSGHTTTFIALAVGLGFLFPKHWKIFILVGFLVSFTRVIFYDHYLSDVLATTALVFVFFVQILSWLQTKAIWSKMK
jgi:membrane-associated phospholipid phosphatase